MDRCAVLVDAGYLLGAASTLLTGGSEGRNQLRPDYASMIAGLKQLAADQSELPVLRIYWCDAARERQPTPAHRVLRVLPDVKIRLGKLATRDDGRIEQKGVDADLHADLTSLARHRAVSDVVLVTGDEDLRRAVEEAQQYGVRIHLWAVEAATPAFNQSPELIAAVDRRYVLSRDWISQYIEVPSGAEHVGRLDGDGSATRQPVPAAAAARPSPMDMPARPTPTGYGSGQSGAAFQFSRLYELTTRAQEWRDNEDDATTVIGEPYEVGYVYGTRWSHRVYRQQHDALGRDRPQIPRHVDGDLLRYAERIGVDTWENEEAKRAVRHGFWRAVDDAEQAGEVGIDAEESDGAQSDGAESDGSN